MSKEHDNMKAKAPLREEALRTFFIRDIQRGFVTEEDVQKRIAELKEWRATMDKMQKQDTYVFVKETEWDFKNGDDNHLASATKEMTTDDGKTLRVVRTYYNSQIDSRGWTMAEHLAHITLEACGSMGSMSEYREDYYLFGTDGKLIRRWWIFA